MKFKKIIYFLLPILILYVFTNNYIIQKNVLFSLKDKFSTKTKTKIKKYLFPYKHIKELNDIIGMFKITVGIKQNEILELRERLNKKDMILSAIPEKLGYGEFYEQKETIFKINKRNFKFKAFKDDFLEVRKSSGAKSGSIYVDKFDDKVIILSANGYFQYFDKKELDENKFKTQIIKSNIKDIIKHNDFYYNSKYGVKDLFIEDNDIYFSFTREVKNNCFNTSILKAKLNFEKLVFNEFFFPSECIMTDYQYFDPHSAGGRMAKFKDKIIFSIGEYLTKDTAQDHKSIFGKIVALDPLDKNYYKLLSIGHRNPQGLFIDEKNKTILSTEHGPQGGDEININKNFIRGSDKINNYGWPISSYGEHYGFKKKGDMPKAYEKYPYYKSHKDHGFEEPLKYFVPSIGISQIIKLNDNFFNDQQNNHLLVGALGFDPTKGGKSLHYIKTSKNYQKIIDHQIININNRVRDVVVLDEKQVLVTLETSSTIGVLKIVE